jgi:L-asparaginase II
VSDPVVLARVIRSGVEESVHLGHVAVCDTSGRLIASAGDPGRILFARSSMKPLQAAVSLSLIDDELRDDEVAVMCGSHTGEPVHVDTVLRLLSRADLGLDALRCPPAWPQSYEDARSYEEPRRELHNCSGKHAGMLLASRRAGLPIDTYLEPDHPLQRAVTGAVARVTGAEPVAVGVDGCGVPVHAVPLRAMATLFARIVDPDADEPLAPHLTRAVTAMRAAPYLVGGRGILDTSLTERVENVIAKRGAEALQCVGVMGRGIGVAVRVDDGSTRAAGPSTLRALEVLEVVGSEQLDALAPFARPPVFGGGRSVGALTSDFTLNWS